MRTLLSQFCESFDRIARPLLDPLNSSAKALLEASADLPGKEVRGELLDLRHQMEALVEKVAEQQAYVLIFGPLKSGKSTLMNALAGAYVSEVSSLPAYPCMVFLSHSEERQFDVTYYNGSRERFTDPSALYMHINRAHGELAERIRTAEERGQIFDPAVHFPEAIRRVDVRIPAGELDQSSAVLVDTPGLYSRMRFGYDRMTRDFRDAASCAIFIVKSDNLFLEQVFEEFEDLLELFNRIFLVVNLDTGKQDLSPDGTLVPSLEREDPLRIIDAFESLAMSAPLKEAAAEGRLRIYPVDLMHSASARLQGREGDQENAHGQANFDAFQGDLTEYLNSTDYLVSFLGDSLRRARTLMDEAQALLAHSAVEELRSRAEELDGARQDAQRRRYAVVRLQAHDWRGAFDALQEKLEPAIRLRARQAGEETERALDGLLETWFSTDASLQTLVRDELVPALREYQQDLTGFIRETLDEEVLSGSAGILLPADISADLYAAEVDLGALGKDSLSRLSPCSTQSDIPIPFHSSQIPVRRGFWDWILFRNKNTVRERLFGSANAPSLRIRPEIKARRLGQATRDAIRRQLDVYKTRFFDDTVKSINSLIIGRYTSAAAVGMTEALCSRDTELDARLDEVVGKLMEHRRVLAHFSTLRSQTERAERALQELTEEYGSTEPALLIQPMEPPVETIPARPPAGPLGTSPMETQLQDALSQSVLNAAMEEEQMARPEVSAIETPLSGDELD